MLRPCDMRVSTAALAVVVGLCPAPGVFTSPATAVGGGPGQTMCVTWEFLEDCCAGGLTLWCNGVKCVGILAPPQPFATTKYIQSAWADGPAWDVNTPCDAVDIRCRFEFLTCGGPTDPNPCVRDPNQFTFRYCGSGCASPPPANWQTCPGGPL